MSIYLRKDKHQEYTRNIVNKAMNTHDSDLKRHLSRHSTEKALDWKGTEPVTIQGRCNVTTHLLEMKTLSDVTTHLLEMKTHRAMSPHTR